MGKLGETLAARPAARLMMAAIMLLLLLGVSSTATYAAGTTATGTGTGTTTTTTTTTQAVAGKYAGLWVGQMSRADIVANAPGGRTIKSWGYGRRVLLYAQARDVRGGVWYLVSQPPEQAQYVRATSVQLVMPVKFQPALYAGKWVNVDLTQQVVTAYDNGVPVLVTLGSSGTAKHPTPAGVYHVLYRFTATEMKGGSKATGDYYDLPNVPYTQYFDNRGDALHGTYWHDNFGRPMSHGCINLSTPIAGWFFNWATYGTTVYVHY